MTARSRAHRILSKLDSYKAVSKEDFLVSENNGALGRHIGTYAGLTRNGIVHFYENGIEYNRSENKVFFYQDIGSVLAPDGKDSQYIVVNIKGGDVVNIFANSISDLLAMVRYFMRVRDDEEDGTEF